jgi:hypothetical protein
MSRSHALGIAFAALCATACAHGQPPAVHQDEIRGARSDQPRRNGEIELAPHGKVSVGRMGDGRLLMSANILDAVSGVEVDPAWLGIANPPVSGPLDCTYELVTGSHLARHWICRYRRDFVIWQLTRIGEP